MVGGNGAGFWAKNVAIPGLDAAGPMVRRQRAAAARLREQRVT